MPKEDNYFTQLKNMAISLKPRKTESNLFCCSKWWGNPDLPPQAEYPMMKITEEDGTEGEYPLTFICQIDCEDIAPFDKEGLLPHEGMLYFFAAIDEFIGYDSPEHFPLGRWPRKAVKVKYAKQINMETFNSCILVDDDDQELAEPAMAIDFAECEEDNDGFKILGRPFFEEIRDEFPDAVNLLQLDEDDDLEMRFYDSGNFNILISKADLGFQNWSHAFGFLHSL